MIMHTSVFADIPSSLCFTLPLFFPSDRILSTFTSQQWKHLSNEFLKAQQEKRHSWFKAGGTIKKFRAGLSIFSPIPKLVSLSLTHSHSL